MGGPDPLRVAFSDFWKNSAATEQLFVRAIEQTHRVELVDPSDAQLLVFSESGSRHARFVGTKVHYTGENVRPRWRAADYCMGFDHIGHPAYLRFPYFALLAILDAYAARTVGAGPPWSEREFCLFLYSAPGTAMRSELIDRLSTYRSVVSPGWFRHNTDAPDLSRGYQSTWRASKLAYQRRFRFTIACENSTYPGYTTEKLLDAVLAGTIPIYWGNPKATQDFHPESFVNVHDFADLDELVAYIATVDQDPALASRYLAAGREALVRPPAAYDADLSRFLGRAADAAAQQASRTRYRAAGRAVRLTARESPHTVRRALAAATRPMRVRVARARVRTPGH